MFKFIFYIQNIILMFENWKTLSFSIFDPNHTETCAVNNIICFHVGTHGRNVNRLAGSVMYIFSLF